MHRELEGPSARGSARSLSWAILLLAGCTGAGTSKVPDFIAALPSLGAASARQDSAMREFARDLEAWSVHAGRPSSAEALIGPMFLRTSHLHSAPPSADTGLEAGYQRLEVRFAELLASGDSLSHAANRARDQLVEWTGRKATPLEEYTDRFRAAVFPPPANDPGRGAVALKVKCTMISVTVLPSKEGVRICVLKEKRCTRMPADEFGDAWWSVQCIQSCFDYIGWVPEGGSFTVGAT